MSEMVQRVACAIEDNLDGARERWSEIVARAVLAAMREPTDAMTAVADAAIDDYYDGGKESSVEGAAGAVYRAMIDAALKDP